MKFWSEEYKKKLIDPKKLQETVASIRRHKKTISTLNGSFDLMHAGHLQIIYEASLVADVLIVALNSDASIQAYKSSDRPIIPLEYRLQLMAALEFVDYVTWFDELDPLRLLGEIKPDVHVNGAEYGANCIEAETVKRHGGKIHVVELVPGLSTSQILKKIVSIGDGRKTTCA
ncbi:MAG: adenylyltransferase/cytidyltransferase family protein [Parachlamydiaceae bacterium]